MCFGATIAANLGHVESGSYGECGSEVSGQAAKPDTMVRYSSSSRSKPMNLRTDDLLRPTVYQKVNDVPAGTCCEIEAGRIRIRPYQTISFDTGASGFR